MISSRRPVWGLTVDLVPNQASGLALRLNCIRGLEQPRILLHPKGDLEAALERGRVAQRTGAVGARLDREGWPESLCGTLAPCRTPGLHSREVTSGAWWPCALTGVE